MYPSIPEDPMDSSRKIRRKHQPKSVFVVLDSGINVSFVHADNNSVAACQDKEGTKNEEIKLVRVHQGHVEGRGDSL